MLLDTENARSTDALRRVDGRRRARAPAAGGGDGQGAAASDAGREVTAAAIQVHGGIGFTWEADVHWLLKRAQIDAALLGSAGSTVSEWLRSVDLASG